MKLISIGTAAFLIFNGIPLTSSFASENELTLNETQRFVPALTLDQANAQIPAVEDQIPSGAAVYNENPLSLAALGGDPVPEGALEVREGESIQTAIDQAQAGDTVYVHAGTYHESITLKQGVNLTGEDKETTIIHGDYVSGASVIRALGNNTIENLTVTGARDAQGQALAAGIRIEGDHVTVRDNKILYNLSAGVYVQVNVPDVLIEGNLFHGNPVAIKEPKSGNKIRYNTIVGYETNDLYPRISGIRYVPNQGFRLTIQNPQGVYSYRVEYSNDYGQTWVRARVQDPPGVFTDQLVLANSSATTTWLDDGSTTSPGPLDVDVRWYRVLVAESFASKIGIQILENHSPTIRNNIIAHQTVQSIWEEVATPFFGNASVEDNTLFHNSEKGDASGPHLPPQISRWAFGNVLADPQFTDPSHGDYTVPESSPAFYRGAFVPEILRFAIDRAYYVNKWTGATYVIEQILSAGQLTGWRFVYSEGSSESFYKDGTKELDTTPPVIEILSTKKLTNQAAYELRYTVDGVEQTEIRTLVEGVNTLTVFAADIFGNAATASLSVTLDLSASDFTWLGGVSSLWSAAANWLGGVVPGLSDIAVFGPYAVSNCVIDAAANVRGITMSSAYTGTVTQQANVTVTNDFSQAGGRWLDSSPTAHAFAIGNSFSISGTAGAFNRYGDPAGGVYQIRDVYDLQAMSGFLSSSFVLASDIDASSTANWNAGAGFDPVGNYGEGNNFGGIFDGSGHVISDLAINRPMEESVGLFGYAENAVLRNIGIVGGSIMGGALTGGLVGYLQSSSIANSYTTGNVTSDARYGNVTGGLVGYMNTSSVTNCHATGNVLGGSYVGGLIGQNYMSSITRSYATGNVSSSAVGAERIGGLIGLNYYSSTITDSYATGVVGGSGNRSVGGLAGENYLASITDSYATGNVSGLTNIGGLVGSNIAGDITRSYATSHVTGANGAYIGGLAGSNLYSDGVSASISDSYATGIVEGGDFSSAVGGLVGFNRSVISSSYATGTVSGRQDVGGLVGTLSGVISDSYATGAVVGSAGSSNVGGFVGGQYSSVGTGGSPSIGSITNSYATGSVTGGTGSSYVGGFLGQINSGAITRNSYATGAVSAGSGSSGVGGFAGANAGTLTSSYFTDSAHDNGFGTYEANGSVAFRGSSHPVYDQTGANPWDFTNVWDSFNYAFPHLKWEHYTVEYPITTFYPSGRIESMTLESPDGPDGNIYYHYEDTVANLCDWAKRETANAEGEIAFSYFYHPGTGVIQYKDSFSDVARTQRLMRYEYNIAGVLVAKTNPQGITSYFNPSNGALVRVAIQPAELTDPVPSIEIVGPMITQAPVPSNEFTMKFDQTMRGVRYEVQYRTSLLSGTWQVADSFVADHYGASSWQDPAPNRGSTVFYRIVAKEMTTVADLLTQINLLYFDPAFGLVEPTHEYPSEGWASRDFTQPSNFGFHAYLLATIAAGDLVTATISKTEAVRRLNVLMDSLLADQRNPAIGYKGLLPWMSYNGTDWVRMDDAYGRQVAFEDNSNLTNALGVAYGALLDDSLTGNTTVRGNGGADRGILGKIDDFLAAQEEGYRAMYNAGNKTFSRAMSVVDGSVYGGTIDYFGAESQGPLLFLVLQYGNAFSPGAYSKLSFTTRTYAQTGQEVPAPFTGAFHLYWPALLMPESENPDLRAMLETYTDIQMDYADRNDHPGLLSAAYDVYPEYLLSRNVSAFSWMGDVVTGSWQNGSLHVTSPTNAGIGIAITDGSKFTFEGSEMRLRYSSTTAVPNARIEFKKVVNGVLTVVHTEYLSMENTGGVERTVTVSLPSNGVLGGLKEVVLATSGGSALDMTIHGFDTERILYNFPLGIREIAWNQAECVETTPSVYNLGAAHMFRPAQVETLLQGLLEDHPDLITAHGLWEGKNLASGTVVREQVFNNVTTFVLGMTGTGPSYITRYFENKNLAAELDSIWNSQTPVSVTGQGTPTNFQWDVYKGTSWKLDESVRASDRQIRITYQSDTAVTGAKFDLKYSSSGSEPVYSVLFDLPATGGAAGEVLLTIPESILYWYISEMVVVFPQAAGFPSETIDRIVLAPEGVVMPPQVIFDAATPVLIKTKSLTVHYTVEGIARTKFFEGLVEGSNTLSITAADVPGLLEPVTWNVTVDTIAPVVVLSSKNPSVINETSVAIFYMVDGVERSEVFNGLTPGMNTLSVTGTDPAGNQTTVDLDVLVDVAGHDFLEDPRVLITFDGGDGSMAWETDHLRLTSTNHQGLGVAALAPGIDVVGRRLQFRYSSAPLFPVSAKIEFKKKDGFGVPRVVGYRPVDISNTHGDVYTVDLGVIPPGIPDDLDEVVFVVQGDGRPFEISIYDFILYDLPPEEPVVTVQINSNAVYTNSSVGLISIDLSGAPAGFSEMRFSKDGTTWSPWQGYAAVFGYAFPDGDGTKTIYVEVRDSAGNVLAATDSIILETVAPGGSVVINNGAPTTNSLDVTLALTASDATSGVDTVRFSVDGGTTWTAWEAFAPAKTLSFIGTGGTGTKEIRYEVKDKAGNVATFSDSILYDLNVPAGASVVSVVAGDRRLFVQNRKADGTLDLAAAFVAKGVNWSPTSANSYPDGDPLTFRKEFVKWYETDIPLMAQMGINVVRVYHDFGTGPDAIKILDLLYHYGIKVIMTVDSPLSTSRAELSNISTVVNAYKNHPAILMWAVGNEWDLNKYYGKYATFEEAAAFTEQAAQLIKSFDASHPVTTVMGDSYYAKIAASSLVPSVDVWGINIYRGQGFGEAINQWEAVSGKPFYIGEFGADSYDHRISGENQLMQAQMNGGLWDEVYFDLSAERTEGALIGALAFEWNDEWWKGGSPGVHTISYESNTGQPDGHNDEKWFGIVDVDRNVKEAYAAMQGRFVDPAEGVQTNATPLITVISQEDTWRGSIRIKLEDKVCSYRAGQEYGYTGITVAVIDGNTGIRLSDVRTFGGPSEDMINYISSLPVGTAIAVSVADNAGFTDANGVPWGNPVVTQAYELFESLGSDLVREVKHRYGWAMIAVKGQGVLAEAISAPPVNPAPTDPVQRTPVTVSVRLTPLPLNPDAGRRPEPMTVTSQPLLSSEAPGIQAVISEEPVREETFAAEAVPQIVSLPSSSVPTWNTKVPLQLRGADLWAAARRAFNKAEKKDHPAMPESTIFLPTGNRGNSQSLGSSSKSGKKISSKERLPFRSATLKNKVIPVLAQGSLILTNICGGPFADTAFCVLGADPTPRQD